MPKTPPPVHPAEKAPPCRDQTLRRTKRFKSNKKETRKRYHRVSHTQTAVFDRQRHSSSYSSTVTHVEIMLTSGAAADDAGSDGDCCLRIHCWRCQETVLLAKGTCNVYCHDGHKSLQQPSLSIISSTGRIRAMASSAQQALAKSDNNSR